MNKSPEDQPEKTATDQLSDQHLQEMLMQWAQTPQPAPAYLANRIMANLPSSTPVAAVLRWLFTSVWRGAGAAALPILLGFTVGINAASTQVSADDFDIDFDIEALVFVEPTFSEQDEVLNFDEI